MIDFIERYKEIILFLLTAALLFIPLERFLPRKKEQKITRKYLRTDVLHALFGNILTYFISILFVVYMVVAFEPLIPDRLQSFVSAQAFWLQFIVLFLLADLYYYWVHRLFHTVPVLWRFHAVHHSIEDMDWVAAHRVHPLDVAVTNGGVLIVALILKIDLAVLALHAFQFSWHSLAKHSNVKISWGPLRWIYETPSFHHWHHGNQAEAYDKNFAGQFPLWDVLFGTAIMEETSTPEDYGVDDPVPNTFLGQLIYPFKRRRD